MTLSKLANPHLKKVVPYTPGVSSDVVRRLSGVKNAIKLSSNESALGPAPAVIRDAQKSLERMHRYPDSSCFELRKALTKFLKVKSDQLIFGNGSDELIVMAIRAFTNKVSIVLTAKPTFLVYNIATRVHDAKLVEVPLLNYAYDLHSMRKKITSKTKLIFIANPDNPTGSRIPKNELKAFVNSVPKTCIIFIDEAYHEYALKDDSYESCLSLIRRPNVIVSRTFSKAYGLSGLRIGYCIASEALIDAMNRVREPFNVNSIAQVAALAALREQSYLKKILDLNEFEKKRIVLFLKRTGFKVFPSATNFVMFKVRNANQLARDLMSRGVILRNLDGWGLKNCLRVTISKPSENNTFIRVMNKIAKESSAQL